MTTSSVFPLLVAFSVALASFLSFIVQPLVGKLLLPVQGGAASTWLAVMLFFQSALLIGYSWAAWLSQRRPIMQVGAMAFLSLVAVSGSRLTWIRESHSTGLLGILFTLSIAMLPAMILVFCIGPLMHGWLHRRSEPVPYHLFALSNVGSLVAVILYPFAIEPTVGLSEQIYFWQGLIRVLAGIVGLCGFIFMRTPTSELREAEGPLEDLSLLQRCGWIALSAMSCVGLLGATHYLTGEIGSNPLAWVGPFGGFLLSFIVTFSGRWQSRFNLVCLGWLALSLTSFMVLKGVSPAAVDGWSIFWLLSLTTAGSFYCNGLLYQTRPKKRFSYFYIGIAAGGVVGGLFASIGVPFFFPRPTEFIFVSSILLAVGSLLLASRKDALVCIVIVLIATSPVLGLIWKQSKEESAGMLQLRRFRNVYGYLVLRFESGGLTLSSETTTHGTQLTSNLESRRHPTLYYTESSGIGRVIEETKKIKPDIKIGVIGVGAGTLAAYARMTDEIDFWDINPAAIRIAQDFFTFIRDSPGKIRVSRADGRKGLESTSVDYDLVVIDAFHGDAIPSHLVTQEALRIYIERITKQKGVVAIHATNRYSFLFPIVGATAASLGCSAVDVVTEIAHTTQEKDWDGLTTEYIFVGTKDKISHLINVLPQSEDEGRVKRTVTVYENPDPGASIIWTDDRYAALDSLDLKRFLFGK